MVAKNVFWLGVALEMADTLISTIDTRFCKTSSEPFSPLGCIFAQLCNMLYNATLPPTIIKECELFIWHCLVIQSLSICICIQMVVVYFNAILLCITFGKCHDLSLSVFLNRPFQQRWKPPGVIHLLNVLESNTGASKTRSGNITVSK